MFKYKLFVLILIITGIFCFKTIYADNNELSLIGKVIYIDPGHGGVDPGALYKNVYEADINLDISKKVSDILTSRGGVVYLTRDGNYDLSLPGVSARKRSDLSRRANIINDSMCDIYVSIHLNAESTGIWSGAQVFYDDINPQNKLIAEIMQQRLSKDLKTDRKYKEIKDMYLHKRVKRPGVLVEVGFISNASERYLLMKDSYRQKAALSIANGIEEYLTK